MRNFFRKLSFFTKIHRVKLVLAADVLSVPFLFFLRWMAAFMLSTDKPCFYSLMGLQCFTCGGTRCVNYFLNGDFYNAFMMNQFVFVSIILLITIFALINFVVLFDLSFAKKCLAQMFSTKGLIFILTFAVSFLIIRNIDNLIDIVKSLIDSGILQN